MGLGWVRCVMGWLVVCINQPMCINQPDAKNSRPGVPVLCLLALVFIICSPIAFAATLRDLCVKQHWSLDEATSDVTGRRIEKKNEGTVALRPCLWLLYGRAEWCHTLTHPERPMPICGLRCQLRYHSVFLHIEALLLTMKT